MHFQSCVFSCTVKMLPKVDALNRKTRSKWIIMRQILHILNLFNFITSGVVVLQKTSQQIHQSKNCTILMGPISK